jgi:eukaryotic translation initiation factor 2C
MKSNNYAAEQMLRSCGITISSQFTQVQGRVLTAPKVSSLLSIDIL